MRSTPIGIAMMNDERPHVYSLNNPQNQAIIDAWADLIRQNVTNIDGTAPKVVVASEIITSTRVAQKVGEELARAGCKQLIACYNVWNFPFFIWPLLNSFGRDKPVLSLSNNNGEYPGNVGLLATDGALRQAGIRTHRICGDQNDPNTQKLVFDWIRASQAVTTMRNEVYGMYGGHSMGMETGFFHLVPIVKAIGTTVYQIDQLWLMKRMEQMPDSEVERGRKWFEQMLGPRLKYDGKMLTPATLSTQIRLYLAMKSVNEENGFDLCGLKGQRELTELICLGDVPEMLLNDPYDWNGPKEPTVCATEADAFAALTQQMLKYISGGMPTLFMDVRLYHPELDLWDFCNSGNHSSWYAARSWDPAENMKKVTFHPALEFYFKAGGASVEFDAAAGPLTFARLGLWDDKLYMVITRGESLELPADQRAAIDAQTNPTWPHVHARLAGTFEDFMTVFPANHAQAVAGDHVRALANICEISGITPIIFGEEGATRVAPIWERMR